MTSVVLNISPLLQELRHANIKELVKDAKNSSKILKNWDELMKALSLAGGKIARGEKLGGDLKRIGSLATQLSGSAAEFGSMLPGPIGVACSLALAIVCLMPPAIDIVGFLLNLMGCIPFAKQGIKIAKPLINDIIREAMKSPLVKGSVRGAGDIRLISQNGC